MCFLINILLQPTTITSALIEGRAKNSSRRSQRGTPFILSLRRAVTHTCTHTHVCTQGTRAHARTHSNVLRWLTGKCLVEWDCIAEQLPWFEANESILDPSLVVFHHVLVHFRVVLPDVSFSGSIRNSSEAERRRVRIRVLKLRERNGTTEVNTEKKRRTKPVEPRLCVGNESSWIDALLFGDGREHVIDYIPSPS